MQRQVVEKALEELQTSIVLLYLGKNIINSLLVFVTLFLFIVVLGINFYFAIIPSIFYLFIGSYFSYRKDRYLNVEDKFPNLKEQLRTVSDNVNKSNLIIDSLKDDVVKNISKVKSGEFIEYNSMFLKVIYIALIGIIIVLASSMNVNFAFDFNIPFLEPSARDMGNEFSNVNLSYKEGNLSDILGNKSVAKLGNRELNLIINPLDSEVDINSIKSVSKEDFTPPNFPKEIYTSYDAAFNERIAKQNQKVVKDYFQQISG